MASRSLRARRQRDSLQRDEVHFVDHIFVVCVENVVERPFRVIWPLTRNGDDDINENGFAEPAGSSAAGLAAEGCKG